MAKCVARLHEALLAGLVGSILGRGESAFADAAARDALSLAPAYWPPMIALAFAVICALAMTIFAFWHQERRRRDAELSPRQFNEQIEIAAATVNLGLWSWCPNHDRVWMTPHCRRMLGIEETTEIDLGLAISRSILSAHGGKIWCENNESGDAVFGFSLPAFERSMAWTN